MARAAIMGLHGDGAGMADVLNVLAEALGITIAVLSPHAEGFEKNVADVTVLVERHARANWQTRDTMGV